MVGTGTCHVLHGLLGPRWAGLGQSRPVHYRCHLRSRAGSGGSSPGGLTRGAQVLLAPLGSVRRLAGTPGKTRWAHNPRDETCFERAASPHYLLITLNSWGQRGGPASLLHFMKAVSHGVRCRKAPTGRTDMLG